MGTIVGAIAAVAAWLAWALFSETRHNHGFWVALLLPLVLILSPLILLVFLLVNYISLIAFIAIGRRAEHGEFMRRLRVRSGLFLLF